MAMDPRSFQLKMQAKQLENEAKRLQKESLKERNKAKASLKKGNRAAAQLYAQNAAKYEQQATSLLQNSAVSTGFATDMRSAAVSAQMARAMDATASGMTDATKAVNMEKVSAQRTKLNDLKSKMDAAHVLITEGDDQAEVNANADEFLANLEDEINAEAMGAMADMGGAVAEPTSKEAGKAQGMK